MSKAFRNEVLLLIEQVKSTQSKFSEELNVMKDALNAITGEHASEFTKVSPPQSADLKLVGKKIDKLAVWVESIQQQMTAKMKVLSALDTKSRKSNLIFDGILETVMNEDLIPFIGSLLASFIPNFDQKLIENAFRLGKSYSYDRSPRRVLVSFHSSAARDMVLHSASIIARAGPPGCKIYINEDIPDDVKRRSADVY